MQASGISLNRLPNTLAHIEYVSTSSHLSISELMLSGQSMQVHRHLNHWPKVGVYE